MLEKFKLKPTPIVIVLKVISALLTIALLAIYVQTFYPAPEKYDTEGDVRESRAFDAIVDAVEAVYIDEIDHSHLQVVKQTFQLCNITWIYEGTFNGYNIYSKIEYIVGSEGESKTAYCMTQSGKLWYKNGNSITQEDGISTSIISKGDYANANSRFINCEQEYNDLAVSIIFSDMKAKS